MSSLDRLQSLLTLRQAAEEAAGQRLAERGRARAAAEAEQQRLQAQGIEARRALRAQRRSGAPVTGERAAESLARQRYWGRLAAEVDALCARAAAHRAGALAGAIEAERGARAAHAAAIRARQTAEKLWQRRSEAQRRLAARRSEAALEDEVQAIRTATRRRE